MKLKFNLLITILVLLLLAVGYTVQNYILTYFDDCNNVAQKLQGLCTTRWFPFTTVAILAGVLPFTLFIIGALAILKKYE